MNKSVLIAAGGTGGHVFPGLAVAHEFISRGWTVNWLGTEAGLESRLVPENGVPLHCMPVSGIRGKGIATILMAPIRIASSVLKALSLIREVDASLVIGMGGFVAGPAGVAAKLAKRRLVIHEQNAIPGTTNRMLTKFADLNLSAFPVPLKNVQIIGNPLRVSVDGVKARDNDEHEELRVLVMGGSRGARALNTLLPQAIKDAELDVEFTIYHQSGAGRLIETVDSYEKAGLGADVVEFIDDVDERLQWADLIVCRAGALTVSEISAVGLASILIPYPYAIDDHQTANAMYLVKGDAAKVVQENEFDSGLLVNTIKAVFENKAEIAAMSENAFKLGKRGVTAEFVNRCETLVGECA